MRKSSLNPYAASYVPLSRREAANENEDFDSAHELNRGSEVVWFGHQSNNMLAQSQDQNASPSQVQLSSASHASELSKWKDHRGGEFDASTSHYAIEKPEKSYFDEQFDMDLEYLRMTFPGFSQESLSDVYLANICSLDDAVDSLNQLESFPDNLSERLPDTLDIGDVPESSSSVELESQKLHITTAEAGASTSGSSNLSSGG